jgi:hypothetical protein
MKRLTFLSAVFIFLSTHNCFSQVGKGEKMLGGNIGFSSEKTVEPINGGKYTFTDFSLSPKLGFGLSKNWVLGGLLEFTGSKSTGEYYGTTIKDHMYSFGMFARKFIPFKEQFGFFTEGDAKYGFGNRVETYSNSPEEKSKKQQYSISISPGVYFKPTKKFFVQASVGILSYSASTTHPTDGVKGKDNRFDFTLTNNLSLGLFFVL